MRCALSCLASALLLFAMGASPRAVDAKEVSWTELVKAFRKSFKGDKSIRDRTLSLLKISKSGDYRGIDVLLTAYKGQLKNASKVHKTWEEEEAAWQEKTDRLMKTRQDIIDRERKRAKKKGEEPGMVSIPKEVADWLGANNRVGKAQPEKARIGKIYTKFLNEEEFSKRILKEVARLVNSLDESNKEKGERAALGAVKGASKKRTAHMITLLGYMEGDAATTALVKLAQGTKDVEELQAALGALGRQNSERGKKHLLAQLGHASWTVRGAALYGLSFYKDPEVVDALLAHAAKEEGVLRRRVFGAMASIVEEPVMATMDAWQSWWKANREATIKKWKILDKRGKPVEGEPKRFELKTSSHKGSTSFYGIKTDSKHIIFVVDVSGSMGPRPPKDGEPKEEGPLRIDVARKELLVALQGLSAVDEDDRGAATFNIVAFSTKTTVFKQGSMVVATKRNKEKAKKWIESNIRPQNETDVFAGIEKAFNVISATKEKKNMAKGADTMFVMTDGSPTTGKFVDPNLILAEVARMNKIRQLSIHTIGVGKNHAKGFLQRLAADNHGQYIGREK